MKKWRSENMLFEFYYRFLMYFKKGFKKVKILNYDETKYYDKNNFGYIIKLIKTKLWTKI